MKAKFIALAALVLGMVSCQQDFDGAAQVGGEVDFQLAVAAPELAGTRADGDDQNGHNSAYGAIDYLTDWSDVKLRYTLEVYDAENLTADPVKDRMEKIVEEYTPVTFDLRLVPNRPYRFVVFADFVKDDGTAFHVIGKTLQDITLANDAINEELTDAYFDFEDITVSNSAAQDMTLTRPFGKVRVIATDLAELNLNVNPGKVTVAYETTVPNKFNAVTGKIDAVATTQSFDFPYAASVSKETLAEHYYTVGYDAMVENGRHTHMTLFTDYILADEEMAPIQFTMTVYDKNGDKEENIIKTTEFNTDIPVQRNHLTTIIGNVLTTATEINVDINDDFCDECEIVKNYIGVASARELQAALDNAKAGEINVINFEADINAIKEKYNPIKITEIAETTIILNGNDYKFEGCMQIIGGSNATPNNAHTVFQNIKFETADASSYLGTSFIYCNEQNGNTRYPDNVTITGCAFDGDAASAVGVKLRSLFGKLVVKNTTATDLHSLVQLTSCGKANVEVDGVTIEKSKNGISLGQVTTATIKNVNINTVNYGIRLNGAESITTTIENATINAFIPVNVRNMSDTHNVVVEFVDNAAGLKGNTYEIAFCSNDYEVGVEPQDPKGTFTLQNAEEARAFYGNVTSFSAFDAAINSTNYPYVEAEGAISNPGAAVNVERDVVIDFKDYAFDAGTTAESKNYAIEVYGEYDVTIKNANFTRSGIATDGGANVVFENGIIKQNTGRTSRYVFCAWGGSTITIKDGTFTNDREKNTFFYADAATIIVEGGVFNGVKSKSDRVCGKTANGGKIIIKGGKFNFDPTAYVPSTSVVEKVGSNWVVTPLPVSNDISGAVANVEDGGKVVLAEGTYAIPSEAKGKTLTIIGNENVIIDATKSYGQSIAGANITFEGVTIKGQTSGNYQGFTHTGDLTFNKCTFEGKLTVYSNSTFNNCVFNNKKDYAVWTSWGGDETKFVGCTFNSGGKALLLYGGSAGSKEKTLIVENCVFNSDASNASDKAAIETGNDYDATYNLYITNATVSDNFSVTTPKQDQGGDSLGTNVWGNKDRMPREKLNVYVDGVDVY